MITKEQVEKIMYAPERDRYALVDSLSQDEFEELAGIMWAGRDIDDGYDEPYSYAYWREYARTAGICAGYICEKPLSKYLRLGLDVVRKEQLQDAQ